MADPPVRTCTALSGRLGYNSIIGIVLGMGWGIVCSIFLFASVDGDNEEEEEGGHDLCLSTVSYRTSIL